jgi:hypothetical protein
MVLKKKRDHVVGYGDFGKDLLVPIIILYPFLIDNKCTFLEYFVSYLL